MKTYSYTARDAAGALKRGILRAEDTAAALRSLKARGFVPVSVTDGPVRRPGVFGTPRAVTAAVAVCLAAAVCVGVRLLRAPPEAAAPAAVPQTPVKAAVKAPPPRPAAAREAAAAPAPPSAAQAPAAAGGEPAPAAAPPPPVPPTAAAGTPVAARPQRRVWGAQKRLAEARGKGLRTEPLFRHETESLLAMYIQPGEPATPHPLPENIEEEARLALGEDIAVTPDDTPEQEREKELVAWMKEDMRKFLAGGGTAKAFFELMQRRQEEEAGLLLEARKVLFEYHRQGNTAQTLEAYQALNEALRSKGIAPMPLPGSLRKFDRQQTREE
jgi:type IV secretory pathway VirB10-like protein